MTSGNEVVDAVATKVVNEIDQSLNESETGDGDSSIVFDSQETPRGGAGAEGDSNRNADDSISYGKSMVSEPDESDG